MRFVLIGIAALSLATVLAGCSARSASVTDEGVAPGVPGNVHFHWSFERHTCAEVPDVASVQVSLLGLQSAVFSCHDAVRNEDGGVIEDVPAGPYTFSVQALSADGMPLYAGGGTVTVNGDQNVPAELVRAGQPGHVQLNWTFRKDTVDGQREAVGCDAAGITSNEGVSQIALTIDNGPRLVHPCSEGGAEGRLILLSVGTHSLRVEGLITRVLATGNRTDTWYRSEVTLVVSAQPQTRAVTLDPVGAGATFLQVKPDGTPFSCAAAGAVKFRVWLTDSHGTRQQDDVLDCADYEGRGFRWDYLAADDSFDTSADRWLASWTINVEAVGAGGEIRAAGDKAAQVYAGYRDQVFQVPLVTR